jgi:hypothetical protein
LPGIFDSAQAEPLRERSRARPPSRWEIAGCRDPSQQVGGSSLDRCRSPRARIDSTLVVCRSSCPRSCSWFTWRRGRRRLRRADSRRAARIVVRRAVLGVPCGRNRVVAGGQASRVGSRSARRAARFAAAAASSGAAAAEIAAADPALDDRRRTGRPAAKRTRRTVSSSSSDASRRMPLGDAGATSTRRGARPTATSLRPTVHAPARAARARTQTLGCTCGSRWPRTTRASKGASSMFRACQGFSADSRHRMAAQRALNAKIAPVQY